MKVLMVASELAPWAKTGGLADAVAGLCAALARRGHDVAVLLPRYAHLRPPATATKALGRHNASFQLRALEDETEFRTILLDAPELFTETGIYAGDERDAARFIALCEAALELPAILRWQPDIVHCHDWHAALLPVMLGAVPGHAPTVLTLHNIGYQGIFASDAVIAASDIGLGGLADGATVNFLKNGIAAADAVTTVSPTYAREILTEPFAMGLGADLRARPEAPLGLLNGVDYGTWGPDSDPFIAQHYERGNLAPKRAIKRALLEERGLASGEAPLIGIVTRLAEQKGIDLFVAALPSLLRDTDAAFVVLGSGDETLADALRAHSQAAPLRVSFTDGYDESLAHRIIAGSDFVLVPSRYEPCGLTQLYALRYGSIPIVRKTGGLADTIHHFDPASGAGNGSVFEHADAQGLLWATTTALQWYRDGMAWSRLTDNAMAADHSWDRQVTGYEELYTRLLAGC